MNDLISRQAAIDAIRASASKYTGFMEMEMYTDDDAVEAIEGLPSAQPDSHCNTCRYRNLEWYEEPCDSCTMGGESNHYKPSAQPEQRWIPVSEKLPEIKEHHTSEPCIVYCDNGAYAFAELEENIFGQVGWDCERDDDYHEAVGTVIAWMPLPEPWRGEEHEL